MNSNEFKRYYLKWSNTVIFCIMGLLMSVVAADAFLGFDFSKDMYTICFIATGCMFGFMSMTWISALNFICSGRREVAIPSLSDEERSNLEKYRDLMVERQGQSLEAGPVETSEHKVLS